MGRKKRGPAGSILFLGNLNYLASYLDRIHPGSHRYDEGELEPGRPCQIQSLFGPFVTLYLMP